MTKFSKEYQGAETDDLRDGCQRKLEICNLLAEREHKMGRQKCCVKKFVRRCTESLTDQVSMRV
jgi:hypothetical protein